MSVRNQIAETLISILLPVNGLFEYLEAKFKFEGCFFIFLIELINFMFLFDRIG
jgi:hypothetical protein